jgi:hypothetical protein
MEIKEKYPYMDEDGIVDEEVHYIMKKSELKVLVQFLDFALSTPRAKFHTRLYDVQKWRKLFGNVCK